MNPNDVYAQSNMQNGLSNQMGVYQNASSLYNGLSQYGLGSLGQWGNPFAPAITPVDDGSWDMGRAESWANDGIALRNRIEFWVCFGLLGRAVARRLAPQLERVTDRVESYLESAKRKQRDGTQ